MRFTFLSLANENHRWAIDTENESGGYDWTRSGTVISRYVSQFDTIGDGEVQHSPDVCPGNDFLTSLDFVLSLTPHLAGMDNEVFERVYRIFYCQFPDAELLDFIRKIKPKEDKYHDYINLRDRKRSTSKSKQYDKRWSKVDDWYDGTIDAVFRALYEMGSFRHMDVMQVILYQRHVYRHFGVCDYSMGFKLHEDSHTVYSGQNKEDLERFIGRVAMISDYCKARWNVNSLERSLANKHTFDMQALTRVA